jgi:hypothetical protein
MKTRLGVAIALALMGLVAPASADTIANFTLDNVTFNDDGTATGSFTLDLTTSTLSNIDITTSTDGDLGTTYTQGVFTNGPGTFDFFAGLPFEGDSFDIVLSDTLTGTNLASPTSFTIASGTDSIFFAPVCGLVPCDGRIVAGGSLDEVPAATPLPAALPLFAGGLGMVGLLSRRRKQKADAAAA